MQPIVSLAVAFDRDYRGLLATRRHLRARVLAKRRTARLGDALIAQGCLDRGILC
jgi:hypothetical protein